MAIQKENDLIQEAFEVEADDIGFCLDQKWGDYENPYENSDTALAFNLFKKGWQAKSKAVPEGMELVSRQSLIDLQQKLHISLENEVIAKEAIDYLDSKLSKKTDVPEGFVLVPQASLKVALSWMDADIDPWQMSSDCFSELYEHKPILEKAMEAQEQSHD